MRHDIEKRERWQGDILREPELPDQGFGDHAIKKKREECFTRHSDTFEGERGKRWKITNVGSRGVKGREKGPRPGKNKDKERWEWLDIFCKRLKWMT